MIKIFKMLFNRHYVIMYSSCGQYAYKKRVFKTKSNEMYVKFAGRFSFLLDDMTTNDGYLWKPLTWIIEE